MPDAFKFKRNKHRGGQPGNVNAARTLTYTRNLWHRIDRRSGLAKSIQFHIAGQLPSFGLTSVDELDGIEREAVIRHAVLAAIREGSQGRLHAAYEAQDVEQYHAEVARFHEAVAREERSEARLEILIGRRRERRDAIPTLDEYIAAKDRQNAAGQPEEQNPASALREF